MSIKPEEAAEKIPILALISTTSGRHFPGAREVTQILIKQNYNFSQVLVKSPNEIEGAIKNHSLKHFAAVAVFGGDGTVAAAIKALRNKDIPLIILPGGSANLLAREFFIPSNIKFTLSSFKQGKHVLSYATVAEVDGRPLTFDLHFGFFSAVVNETSQRLKRWLGKHAYRLVAIKKSLKARKYRFIFKKDGRTIKAKGYALFVLVNSGPWLMGKRIGPRPKAERLRIVLIKHKSFLSTLTWFLIFITTGRQLPYVTKSWHAKDLKIIKAPHHVNFDDQLTESNLPMRIKMTRQATKIVVPKRSKRTWFEIKRSVTSNYYRLTDGAARMISGIPSERYSRISDRLYLGGQFRNRAIGKFESRNITGIVNMRSDGSGLLKLPNNIDALNLSTRDRHAPSIKDLKIGVSFIKQHIEEGGAVYIHCNMGEGRGPSMAAAYLISNSMRPQDAIAHLQRYRPFAKPNKKQRVRLHEFAEAIKLKNY
jgi:diacylglycerol kinase family enzyme